MRTGQLGLAAMVMASLNRAPDSIAERAVRAVGSRGKQEKANHRISEVPNKTKRGLRRRQCQRR